MNWIILQMSKNKGAQAKKRKVDRNPRVKHREKYRKAKIRRKGQVRSYKPEMNKYSGEASGIRAGVVRGVRIRWPHLCVTYKVSWLLWRRLWFIAGMWWRHFLPRAAEGVWFFGNCCILRLHCVVNMRRMNELCRAPCSLYWAVELHCDYWLREKSRLGRRCKSSQPWNDRSLNICALKLGAIIHGWLRLSRQFELPAVRLRLSMLTPLTCVHGWKLKLLSWRHGAQPSNILCYCLVCEGYK